MSIIKQPLYHMHNQPSTSSYRSNELTDLDGLMKALENGCSPSNFSGATGTPRDFTLRLLEGPSDGPPLDGLADCCVTRFSGGVLFIV